MKSNNLQLQCIEQAVDVLKSADSLLITAGAGIGVDSGLPDFRGNDGFWTAYPALGKQNIEFIDIASPYAFITKPKQAWGFYGHRLNLYCKTIPHQGFELLKIIAESMKSYFIYTSNVDGQFQKAGFNKKNIVEIHGSIHGLQCIKPCKEIVYSAQDFCPITNDEQCQLISDLPRCKSCGEILRPNILMFDDWSWVSHNYDQQNKFYKRWLSEHQNRVIIEMGAGTAIPSIRHHSEKVKGTLIRINPREYQIPKDKGISIEMSSLEAINLIFEQWNK